MNKLTKIIKEKKYLVFLVLFVVIIIAAGIVGNPKKEETPTNYNKTSNQNTALFSKNNDLTKKSEIESVVRKDESVYVTPNYPSIETAEETVFELEQYMPIAIRNFETSVGIKTTINIYTYGTDEKHVMRIEIYGIDYRDSTIDETKNPNVTAFKESFYKALSEIEKHGLDPRDMYYIFGTKEYIRNTAEYWVSELNLLEY